MPGAPKQINSPYGNRPSTLPAPVPNAGMGADIADASSAAAAAVPPMPGGQAAPAQVQPGPQGTGNPEADVDAFLAELDGPGGGSSAPQAGDQFQQEPGFLDAQMQQFRDLGTRFQAGLASNDTEVMSLLKQKYGDSNVRWKDGKAFIRDQSGDKFHALDPKAFEIFSDLVPDMSRGFVEEAAAVPFEVAGATAGFFSPVPGGASMGTSAGRVLAGPAQIAAADKVAEWAGVPQDESRNRHFEMAVQSGLEAAMPVIGKFASKFIPGTAAYKAAKTAGESELSALSKQSLAVAQSAGELAAIDKAVTINGELVGVPGANVTLGAHQLNPESPRIQQLKDKAREFPGFVNAMRAHAEEWGDLFTKTMNEIATRAGKGKEIPSDALGKTVTDAVNTVRKTEGENIAKYKLQAIKTLGEKAQPMNEGVVTQLSNMIQAVGFTPKGPPTKEQLQKMVGQWGITSIGEARAIANNLNDVMTSMQKNGGLSIRDMDRFRNSIGDLSDKFYGTPAGRELANLAGNLRENYKQVIESGIDNEFEKHGFRSAMDDYSSIMQNVGVLRSALSENSSGAAIVNKFFTGKDNLGRIKAIKALSPEAFDGLRAEWLNQEMIKNSSRESATGYSAGKFLDKLEKQYGPEFLAEVLPGQEGKTVKNFLTVMDRVDKEFTPGKIDSATEAHKQGVINTLIGVIGDVKFKTINGLAALTRGRGSAEHAAVQLLTRDGIDKYVAAYPGKNIDKAGIAQKLKDFVAYSRIHRAVDAPATAAASRIGGRTILRADTGANQPEESQ